MDKAGWGMYLDLNAMQRNSSFFVGLIRTNILYLPHSGACGKSAVFNSRLQSTLYRSLLPSRVEMRRSIILIRRSSKRYFTNHDDILAGLKKLVKKYGDYTVEVFDDRQYPTLENTMSMFNRAFMVVAPHGAGESNLMFSEPGTILIEGLCKRANFCYRNLSVAMGLRYHGFLFGSVDCFGATSEHVLPYVQYYLDKIKYSTQDRMA